MVDRVLVMGDNHGDTESLRRVLDDAAAEAIDVAVHVGDFTNAWRTSRQRDDERAGKRRGVEQLRAVEPLLAEVDAHAEHGLVWVWGNQDYFGDLDYDLDVGTMVPDTGHVEVGGHRFTNDPAAVDPDTILVTHMERWSLLDHFDGYAHFCGNSHRGRHLDRRLNSAFLKLTYPDAGTTKYGGYFVVELGDDRFDVDLRPVGDLEPTRCERHGERGVQFRPADADCMYCEDARILWRDMCSTAFYGLTADADADADTVRPDALVDYAASLWTDPPANFRADFREYLSAIDDDRYAPLTTTEDGALRLAETTYMY